MRMVHLWIACAALRSAALSATATVFLFCFIFFILLFDVDAKRWTSTHMTDFRAFFSNARLLLLRWCTIVICRCCCFVTMSAAQRSTTDAVDQELQPSKTKPNAKHKINIWRRKNERNSDGKQDPNVCVFFFHTPSLCYSFLYYRFALQHGKDAKSFAYCFGFWLILAFGEQNDATSPAWRHVVLRAKFKYEVFFFLHSNNNENNLFEWNENAH